MKLNIKSAIAGGVAGGLTGGWAGAGAGALGGLFSGDEAADAKSAYNRQLNDSITLWNMQNAYNTPLQQRKRLEEAGYNPNLWYTQGNTGSASAISQPTLSYAQGGNSPLNKILNALTVKSAKADTNSKELDNEYKQLQLDYLKARIEAIKSGRRGTSAGKLFNPEKIESGSLTNVNTYLSLFDKFGEWARKRHLDSLDKRVFQYFMGDKQAFTKDFEYDA